MSTPTKLIVGLGNPGKKYLNTRHNIGFAIIDRLAEKYGVNLSPHSRVPALTADFTQNGIKWIMMQPATYMNLSGQPVAAALNFWKIDLSSMLVVVDDVELTAESIRIRTSGSTGGHNGLKSITEHVGTKDFSRIRIGIGRPDRGSPLELSEWVLQPFSKTELIWVEKSINKAVCAIESWVQEGPVAAMNQFNSTAQNDKDNSTPL